VAAVQAAVQAEAAAAGNTLPVAAAQDSRARRSWVAGSRAWVGTRIPRAARRSRARAAAAERRVGREAARSAAEALGRAVAAGPEEAAARCRLAQDPSADLRVGAAEDTGPGPAAAP